MGTALVQTEGCDKANSPFFFSLKAFANTPEETTSPCFGQKRTGLLVGDISLKDMSSRWIKLLPRLFLTLHTRY